MRLRLRQRDDCYEEMFSALIAVSGGRDSSIEGQSGQGEEGTGKQPAAGCLQGGNSRCAAKVE
jgi:hypothetical protein